MSVKSAYSESLPVYLDGELDLTKLANLIGIKRQDLAANFGENFPSNEKQTSQILHLLGLLWHLFGGEKGREGICEWLRSRQKPWAGLTPLDCVRMGRTQAVIDAVETHLQGELMGG